MNSNVIESTERSLLDAALDQNRLALEAGETLDDVIAEFERTARARAPSRQASALMTRNAGLPKVR